MCFTLVGHLGFGEGLDEDTALIYSAIIAATFQAPNQSQFEQKWHVEVAKKCSLGWQKLCIEDILIQLKVHSFDYQERNMQSGPI